MLKVLFQIPSFGQSLGSVKTLRLFGHRAATPEVGIHLAGIEFRELTSEPLNMGNLVGFPTKKSRQGSMVDSLAQRTCKYKVSLLGPLLNIDQKGNTKRSKGQKVGIEQLS